MKALRWLSEFRSWLKCLSADGEERALWGSAVIIGAETAFIVWCRLGENYVPYVVGLLFVVYLLSEMARSDHVQKVFELLQPPQIGLTLLVNELCKQRPARRRQRPWLVLSLMAGTSSYLVWAFKPAINIMTSTFDTWFVFGLLLSLTVVAMGLAGAFAEEDPPASHEQALLRFLDTYEVRQPEGDIRLSELKENIKGGHWTLTELVSFANAEARARLNR